MVFDRVLNVVAPVAGIGGIAIASVVYVFRSVIAREFLPQLTKRHAFEIIRLVVVCTFLLGIVGVGAWLFDRHYRARKAVPAPVPVEKVDIPQSTERQGMETAPDGDLPVLSYTYPNDWVSDDTLASAIYKREADGEPEFGFIIVATGAEMPLADLLATDRPNVSADWSPATRAAFVAQSIGENGSATVRDLPLFEEPASTSFNSQYEVIDYRPAEPGNRDGSEQVLRAIYVFGSARSNPPAPPKRTGTVHYYQLTCKAPLVNWKRVSTQCDAVLDSLKISNRNSPGEIEAARATGGS